LSKPTSTLHTGTVLLNAEIGFTRCNTGYKTAN